MIGKILKKIGFGKKEEPKEISVEEQEQNINPINIRVDSLTGVADVDRVTKFVKDGNILFLKLKELQRRDAIEFQNTLQKMKRVCTQFNWDVVALEDGYLIVTPQFAKVER